MTDEEEAISLSEAESEGEGPNIRPPQPAVGTIKHKHKKSKKSKDASKSDRRDDDDRRQRDRKKGSRDRERRRDRERGRDRDIRRERSDDHGGDLRHRIKRDRYDRGGRYERDGERHRYDRSRDESVEEREKRTEHEERMNRIIKANKHMEESRKEVEARKKTRELEKEMERLEAVLKRKKAARKSRSRSRSREKKKKKKRKKSESSEEEEEEVTGEEETAKGSESEEVEEEEEEGSEETGEESGEDSESGAASDATTGSQKSEETPEHEESSEEGEVDDEEEEKERKMEELVNKKPEPKEIVKEPEEMETDPVSPPIGGKWADKSPGDRTPSRSPTPLKMITGNEAIGRSPKRKGDGVHGSNSQSPAVGNHLDSPPLSPVELKDELPPYLPSVHGCRSVAEFKCLNRIEEGTYGIVYRARDKRTQEIVALKRLKMEREKEGFPITSLREINTLLISQHPNVVTVREIVVGSNMDQIFIVMDFVHHDLKSLMETMRKKNQVFLTGEIKCLMVQLIRAINHLHDNWILHRDLKASNLLLSHNGILKVGDFGLAREYGSPLKAYTSVVVTLWYRAPELLLGIKEYSTHIDVWSIGCILGELLLMEPLFPGKSEVDELNRIFKLLGTPSEKIWLGYKDLPGVQKMKFVDNPVSHLREKFPEKMLSDQGLGLLKALLLYDPKKRITCDFALRHEYFREDPRPIDPSMFPTWPAKSEQEPGDKVKKVASPKPPSGGMAFKNMGDDDEDRARGFSLLDAVKNKPPAAGWNLKF